MWTLAYVSDLLNCIGERQKKFLAALYRANGPLTSGLLIERIGANSKAAIGGIVTGLYRQRGKPSINSLRLHDTAVERHGHRREVSFELTADFRRVLMELGWPDGST